MGRTKETKEERGSCEQRSCVWVMRLSSLSCLLTLHYLPLRDSDLPAICSADAENTLNFESSAMLLAGAYLTLDVGCCLFCACRLSWLAKRVYLIGRPCSILVTCLAVGGLFHYGRQLVKHSVRCVGLRGVIVGLGLFIYIFTCALWWMLVECDVLDVGFTEDQGLGAEESTYSSSGCKYFWSLEPWPVPPGGAQVSGRSSNGESGDEEQGLMGSRSTPRSSRSSRIRASSQPAATVVGKSSPQHSASGSAGGNASSGEAKAGIYVLNRNGEVLYVGRTRSAVMRWVKRNLDRDKRKGILIEERGLSGRSARSRSPKSTSRHATSPRQSSKDSRRPPASSPFGE
eukprot:TRINITY_DN96612_c0_g1_i1.p1 TRINITY_DN96612_c0_g1~~TRINITY_DN96612_c0_g1_i1.p1  ORF type:complete len:344 (+),score=37.32 TRINITY_DN96612_c0_g1_i1:35-1066(+)